MNLQTDFDNLLILCVGLFLFLEGVEDMTMFTALLLLFFT